MIYKANGTVQISHLYQCGDRNKTNEHKQHKVANKPNEHKQHKVGNKANESNKAV